MIRKNKIAQQEIIGFVLIMLIVISGARVGAEVYIYWPGCGGDQVWKFPWVLGASMGLWSPSPPQVNSELIKFATMCGVFGTCISPFLSNGALQSSWMVFTYAIGKDTGADLRRLFIYVLVPLIAMIPLALIFNIWLNCHLGISNTGEFALSTRVFNPYAAVLGTGTETLTWGVGNISVWDYCIWSSFGAIFIIIICVLRTMFPWFFLNPVGVILGVHHAGWLGWANVLPALLVKYALYKVLGPRRTEELMVPIVSGFAVGCGFLYLIVSAYTFSTLSLPNLRLLWKG